jgi:heme-degrading monooxygenase HmoA
MIARTWRGWTKAADADAYEHLLTGQVLPELRRIPGYRGGYVLRRPNGEETEFSVVNLFDSLDAVRAFAGDAYETPVFEPEARRLLARIEPRALHYEVRAAPTPAEIGALVAPDGSGGGGPDGGGGQVGGGGKVGDETALGR